MATESEDFSPPVVYPEIKGPVQEGYHERVYFQGFSIFFVALASVSTISTVLEGGLVSEVSGPSDYFPGSLGDLHLKLEIDCRSQKIPPPYINQLQSSLKPAVRKGEIVSVDQDIRLELQDFQWASDLVGTALRLLNALSYDRFAFQCHSPNTCSYSMGKTSLETMKKNVLDRALLREAAKAGFKYVRPHNPGTLEFRRKEAIPALNSFLQIGELRASRHGFAYALFQILNADATNYQIES